MATQLVKHGSEAGYQAELQTGNKCERCRAAHREYNRQYTKAGKASGLKYTRTQVVDHLAGPPRGGVKPGMVGAPPVRSLESPTADPPIWEGEYRLGKATSGNESLAGKVAGLFIPGAADPQDDYVPDAGVSELRAVDPDPEPSGEWAEVSDEEFVLNAAGLRKIEENLGTYLSVVGMTAEMIDPYCGPILAANMDNMVKRWSQVISNYPKAAALFLDSKGGIIFLWMGALQATWPLLMALYDHHLSRNVRVNRQNGTIERKIPGGPRGFDATTPPMPDEFNYSVR